jgi:aminobenzoyl-glutamate utilization protein B
MPTAFVGQYGKGSPCIGILADFDSAQNPSPEKADNGYGCSHDLFNTASLSAGVALKTVLEESGLRGSVKVFGTPAEGMLPGKMSAAKANLFDGLDAALTWHPGEGTHAEYGSFLSLDSIVFEFGGGSDRARLDSEDTRKAVGALELMNERVNRLRGYVPDGTGIHYVSNDGKKPSGETSSCAKSWFWIWTPSRAQTDVVSAEIMRIARGVAKTKGTKVRLVLYSGTDEPLPNVALGELIDRNLRWVGAPRFSLQEKALARRMGLKEPLVEWVEPPKKDYLMSANFDPCNVSWLAPLGLFRTTCRAPKTPRHHWLATIQYGSGIGRKGIHVAAKTLASTALDLLTQPATLRKVQEEFKRKTRGFVQRPSD